MKKQLLLLILILAVGKTKAQNTFPIPQKDGRFFYEVIDTVDLSKNELFAISKKWITDNFKSTKSVIQSEDSENGPDYR